MIVPTEPIVLYPQEKVTRSPVTGEDAKAETPQIRILAERKYQTGGERQADGVELGQSRLFYTFARSPAAAAVRRGWFLRALTLAGRPVFRVRDVAFPMMYGNRWVRVQVEREEVAE